MKIAITGLPSTGKSTLSKAIAERSGLPYMEEQPLLDAAFAYCDNIGYTMSSRYIPTFSPEDLKHWQRGFIKAKLEFDAKHDSYVADGCPLLTITYILSTCWSVFDKEEMREHCKTMLKLAKTYDCIYYLPFGVLPIVDDGRRTTNYNYHMMQDLILHGLFDVRQDEVQIVELHATDLQARIETVMLDIPEKLPLLDVYPAK